MLHQWLPTRGDFDPISTQRMTGNIWRDFKLEMGYWYLQASQVVLVVKNPPAKAGDIRDAGSIFGSGRSPGGGHGNPLQDSCLENLMDRGAWRAIIHGVTKELDMMEAT